MAITFDDFYFECLGRTQKTKEELQSLFNQYEPQLRQMLQGKYTAKLWDGTTPINGVNANVVRERFGMGERDVAYLIYEGDTLVYFQPHGINNEKVTEDNWQKLAAKHIESIIDRLVMFKLLEIAGAVIAQVS